MKNAIVLLLIMSIIFGATPTLANSALTASELGITLDDGTLILGNSLDGFTVNLSKGHPKVPKIKCESATEIYDGFIPLYKNEGYGKVIIGGTEYMIKFQKSTDEFVLQFDDRYNYDFGITGTVNYTSSNDQIISVDENGILIAKQVSDTPVTITASNGTESKTLTVAKVIKML